MKPIRILLAEDQTLMRQGLKTILELESGFEVAGEAEDGKAAVKLALQLRPDIILMDVQMPQMNGVEATAAICRAWPEARVIILTTFDRDDYVFQGVRAGAVGYLLKDLPAPKLIETIRACMTAKCSSSRRLPRAPCAPRCIRRANWWSRCPNASAKCW